METTDSLIQIFLYSPVLGVALPLLTLIVGVRLGWLVAVPLVRMFQAVLEWAFALLVGLALTAFVVQWFGRYVAENGDVSGSALLGGVL